MNFEKGRGDNVLQYPITQEQIDNLLPCDLVNPFAMDDPRVVINEPLMDIPKVGTEEFELELVNVARAVHLSKTRERIDGIDSNSWEMFTTKKEGKFLSDCLKSKYKITRVDQLAEVVHSDFPTQLIDDLFRYLKSSGAKINKSIFKEKPYKVFTDGVVMIEHLIGWAVHSVSPTAFAHKYYFGRPRPEEAIYSWAKGDLKVSATANEALEHYVDKEAVLLDPRSFTMYQEGSPTHPSLPAMHSSLAAMGMLFSVVLDLSDEQKTECIRCAANVAFGRTFAGVHYRLDNLYGLELGERVIAKILPGFLEQYGADSAKVSEIIESNRNNWLN